VQILRQNRRSRIGNTEPLRWRLIINDSKELGLHLLVEDHLAAEIFVEGSDSPGDESKEIIVLGDLLVHQDGNTILVTYSEQRIQLVDLDWLWSIESHIFQLSFVSLQLHLIGFVHCEVDAFQLVELREFCLVEGKDLGEDAETFLSCLVWLGVEMDTINFWSIGCWEKSSVSYLHVFTTSDV
jgi:hypothetical protein